MRLAEWQSKGLVPFRFASPRLRKSVVLLRKCAELLWSCNEMVSKEGKVTVIETLIWAASYVATALAGAYFGSRITETHILRYYKEEQK